jgi:hypothetical protein
MNFGIALQIISVYSSTKISYEKCVTTYDIFNVSFPFYTLNIGPSFGAIRGLYCSQVLYTDRADVPVHLTNKVLHYAGSGKSHI